MDPRPAAAALPYFIGVPAGGRHAAGAEGRAYRPPAGRVEKTLPATGQGR
ncbi:hypothetical protein ACFFOP_14335 [Sinosporangium siamense]